MEPRSCWTTGLAPALRLFRTLSINCGNTSPEVTSILFYSYMDVWHVAMGGASQDCAKKNQIEVLRAQLPSAVFTRVE